ncbi:MAG: phosphopentomutase [Salaquimonas sp.]|jgi:phosphopentomutase|nr:phosphopentomutase [Salaquimonas sp.]
MPRAFIIVLDSFGIGGAPDATDYGDEGAATLGHIAEACFAGAGDRDGLRAGPLRLPNMEHLGLGLAARGATGTLPAGFDPDPLLEGLCAHAVETSQGKDTPSGHWEIAGVPVRFDWGYFPDTEPAFPPELTEAIIREGKLPGILGNKHESGTVVIEQFGEESVRTGKPICYTSADSVLQIAAHEAHFGLERLYDLCVIVRRLVDPYRIGRVIARPFLGETAADFERTGNRKDYAVQPPEPTLLDRLKDAGREVIAIGKIDDIFAHCGTTQIVKAHGNEALFAETLSAADSAPDGSLTFANLVDFDQLFGHRRDVPGYADALERFDRTLPQLQARLKAGDMVVITADHGNDPTWKGTDHTREQVPVLIFGPSVEPRFAGRRDTFTDIGETVAEHLGLEPGRYGKSFLKA